MSAQEHMHRRLAATGEKRPQPARWGGGAWRVPSFSAKGVWTCSYSYSSFSFLCYYCCSHRFRRHLQTMMTKAMSLLLLLVAAANATFFSFSFPPAPAVHPDPPDHLRLLAVPSSSAAAAAAVLLLVVAQPRSAGAPVVDSPRKQQAPALEDGHFLLARHNLAPLTLQQVLLQPKGLEAQ